MKMDEIRYFRGDHAFLSSFYPARVRWHNIWFPTREHAYQASKSENRKDWERIAALPTPGQAKRAGQRLELRPHWESIKEDVMWQLIQRQFVLGSELAEKLVATHPAELIETNQWGDRYWGVSGGEGQNRLGFLLMRWREELMEE